MSILTEGNTRVEFVTTAPLIVVSGMISNVAGLWLPHLSHTHYPPSLLLPALVRSHCLNWAIYLSKARVLWTLYSAPLKRRNVQLEISIHEKDPFQRKWSAFLGGVPNCPFVHVSLPSQTDTRLCLAWWWKGGWEPDSLPLQTVPLETYLKCSLWNPCRPMYRFVFEAFGILIYSHICIYLPFLPLCSC